MENYFSRLSPRLADCPEAFAHYAIAHELAHAHLHNGGWGSIEEHTGSMMGMPYDGRGMMGYDNYNKLYVGTWFSNMSTEMLQMAGARNPQTGVVTLYGAMDEPMLGVHGRTVKYVTWPTDDDHFTFEIIDLHASDDYKVIEVNYTRRK